MKALPAVAISPGWIRRMKNTLHDLAGRLGVDAVRYASLHHFVGRRSRLFRSLGVDLVFDVGANSGQYGAELRRFGYRGRIVSFEPLAVPYAALHKRAARDENWEAVNRALGREPGRQTINVAANSVSSSLLDMLPLHESVAPYARYVGSEVVEVARLDDMSDSYLPGERGPFLKIDAQGYESEILAGARQLLPSLIGLEIELSLAHLYANDTLVDEMMAQLKAFGFGLADLRPGLADGRTGRLLQADGIFVRAGQR